MSTNVILVKSGQCGNQLGHEISSSIYDHFRSLPASANPADTSSSGKPNQNSWKWYEEDEDFDLFFRAGRSGRIYSRSVALDTEPKVINDCIARCRGSGDWEIDARSVAYRHGGAGNNWAMGYAMCSGEYLEIANNLVRRELEYCDAVPLLLSIHSLAGGTGSGLGTKMSESIRDEFPDVTRANLAILPYHFGEVVVQYYNALLSLAKITRSSHGVILYENEVAFDLCRQSRGIDRPSLSDINHTITSHITPILLPRYHEGLKTSFDEDITHLCSHPRYKLLDVKFVPQTFDRSKEFTFDSWTSLIKSISRMQQRGIYSERSSGTQMTNCVTLSAVLTFRGDESEQCATSMKPQSSSRNNSVHSSLFPLSNIHMDPLKLSFGHKPFNGYERSASLFSNSQAVIPTLSRILSRGSDMFKAGAYVHQYDSNGVSSQDFQAAFHEFAQIMESYKSLG